MKYRPEIQGLRAIAIVPVLLYHAGFTWIPAGFFGVDVFFVISGYLITNILLEEMKVGTFSFIHFYKRRIRRLVPVLLAVLCLTLLAGVILYPASRLEELSQSIIAVLAFISNIYFFNTINYFSLGAEQIPLLHTWSLAIEEQFYLLFPFMLLLLKTKSERVMLATILGCSVISLLIAIYLVENQANSMAFYLIFSRAWELLVGAGVAVILRNFIIPTKNLDNLGIIFIVIPMIFVDKSLGHPSFITIFPVLGTALIILNNNKYSPIFKLLTLSPLIYIGALSYSLYLWHQPIFSFMRFLTIGQLSPFQIAIAFFTTISLSILSYKYIESAFNSKSYIKDQYFYPFMLAGVTLLITLCFLTIFNNGFPERMQASLSLPKSTHEAQSCHLAQGQKFDQATICKLNTTETSVAVLGDSHAIELSDAINEKLKSKNNGVTHLTYSACAPSLLYAIKGKEACFYWLNESVEYLIRDNKIEIVVLAFRYSGHIFGTKDIYDTDFEEAYFEFVDESKNKADQKLQNISQSFLFLIDRLLQADKKIIILLPIPEHEAHIETYTTPTPVFGQLDYSVLSEALLLSEYHRRNKFIRELIGSIDNPNVSTIDPTMHLCDELYCAVGNKDEVYYYDSHHLSAAGARKLIHDISWSL